jgi:hypothetical protein
MCLICNISSTSDTAWFRLTVHQWLATGWRFSLNITVHQLSSENNINKFFFQPIYTDYKNWTYFDKRSHLNLLLWNRWTKLKQIWLAWSLGGPLSIFWVLYLQMYSLYVLAFQPFSISTKTRYKLSKSTSICIVQGWFCSVI